VTSSAADPKNIDYIRIQNFTGRNELLGVYRLCNSDRTFVMRKKAQQRNRVTAVFQHAAISIEIARQTSLAQLAERLGTLGEIHGKLILPVHVRVAGAPSQFSGTRV
jgi:hypothetical protein